LFFLIGKMSTRAGWNGFAGRIWPAGRSLVTPVLHDAFTGFKTLKKGISSRTKAHLNNSNCAPIIERISQRQTAAKLASPENVHMSTRYSWESLRNDRSLCNRSCICQIQISSLPWCFEGKPRQLSLGLGLTILYFLECLLMFGLQPTYRQLKHVMSVLVSFRFLAATYIANFFYGITSIETEIHAGMFVLFRVMWMLTRKNLKLWYSCTNKYSKTHDVIH